MTTICGQVRIFHCLKKLPPLLTTEISLCPVASFTGGRKFHILARNTNQFLLSIQMSQLGWNQSFQKNATNNHLISNYGCRAGWVQFLETLPNPLGPLVQTEGSTFWPVLVRFRDSSKVNTLCFVLFAVLKAEKIWGSMQKCAKSCKSMRKFAKMCHKQGKYEKAHKSVLNVRKIKKCEQV